MMPQAIDLDLKNICAATTYHDIYGRDSSAHGNTSRNGSFFGLRSWRNRLHVLRAPDYIHWECTQAWTYTRKPSYYPSTGDVCPPDACIPCEDCSAHEN